MLGGVRLFWLCAREMVPKDLKITGQLACQDESESHINNLEKRR
jgi:hypothetical protein